MRGTPHGHDHFHSYSKIGFRNFFSETNLANYLTTDGSLVLKTKITVIPDQVKLDVNQEEPVAEVPAARMAEILKNDSFSDCYFVCNDNNVVKSHKVLLAARSPVLER